ncbi:hypothetical protein D5086_011404 [Populus alba]|uniref:Uncharacterized protein n=1 Tax=Populus alba TaxID=43335 RepID=A0ACC4CDR7_POPAL
MMHCECYLRKNIRTLDDRSMAGFRKRGQQGLGFTAYPIWLSPVLYLEFPGIGNIQVSMIMGCDDFSIPEPRDGVTTVNKEPDAMRNHVTEHHTGTKSSLFLILLTPRRHGIKISLRH